MVFQVNLSKPIRGFRFKLMNYFNRLLREKKRKENTNRFALRKWVLKGIGGQP